MKRPIVASALAALVALFVTLVTPVPAFAHAHLKKTSPAAGARLTAAPTQLVLTFSEAPALPVSALRLLGPDSVQVALGTLTHDAGALTMTAPITGALKAGRYTVQWQAAGDDGHVQHGSFQFVIADGATGIAAAAAVAPAATMSDSAGVALQPAGMDPSSALYVVIRWMQFAALLLVIGAVAFRWWVLPRAGLALDEATRLALSTGAATSGMRGAWLLVLSTLARLAAQVATMHALPGTAPSLGALLTGTAWGHGWLLEVVALVVVIAAFQRARDHAGSTGAWQAAATATVALAYVPAMSGHAIADRTFAPFTLLLDGIHVLAGGVWLGTLAVILVVGIPVAIRATDTVKSGESVARIVNAFSPLALTCAAVLVFTGIVAARVHVASWAAFTSTSYGRALLVKLALVVLLVAVASWNWRRVKPALETDGPARLARLGRTEVSIALVVLLVTAVLVALPTPFELTR